MQKIARKWSHCTERITYFFKEYTACLIPSCHLAALKHGIAFGYTTSKFTYADSFTAASDAAPEKYTSTSR
ncbi:hypothetical protein D3C86_200600 [compost metagenome]